MRSSLPLLVLALTVSCGGRSFPLPPEPERDAGVPEVARCDVDLLFVVDDSTSMAEEQAALAEALPAMLAAFVDADAAPASVRFGVVSTDLGTAPFELPTCVEPMGDDGRLATLTTGGEGCAPELPRSLTFLPRAPASSPAQTGRDLACLTTRGTRGCGFEQPLEAALKALTPSSSATRFRDGSTGHGDGANAGFLRDDSVLAIVFLGDEDDCSAADPGIFDPHDPRFDTSLNVRCGLSPEALWPVSRYVDGYAALRADHPDRLLVAAVAGVPLDLVADPDAVDYAAVLEDPRMQITVAPGSENHIAPACSVPELGDAAPGRRFTELTRELGERGLLASLCRPDLAPALATVVRRIEQIAARGCR